MLDLSNTGLQSEIGSHTGAKSTHLPARECFHIAPFIRLTLLGLYVALTVPLPLLAGRAGNAIAPLWLWVGISAGAIALHAALSEQTIVDEAGICVTYPSWVPSIFRKGWSLPWAEIKALKPRSTGQGGLVYYFLSQSGMAYLLPMRVAGFSRLVQQIEAKSGIDTKDVRPLAQPWMYLILAIFTFLLFLVDGWTIWMLLTLQN